MARYVDDLTLILPIIAGVDWCDPSVIPMPWKAPQAVDLKGLRIAFHTDNGIISADADTTAVVIRTAKSLSEAVMAVEEARPTGIEQTNDIRAGLLGADGGEGIRNLLRVAGTTQTHPLLQRRQAKMGSAVMSAGDLDLGLEKLNSFRAGMLSFIKNYDAILCPVSPYPALPHGASQDEGVYAGFSYTRAYNLTGWPSAVVRGGTSAEGLPIGVQVVARPWREDVALAVARHIETTGGGWQRPGL